jgi:short-subunit dehydrogenase
MDNIHERAMNLESRNNRVNAKILHDRITAVTGSTMGNGRAIAELSSAHGLNVAVLGRDQETDVAAHEIRRKHKTRQHAMRADMACNSLRRPTANPSEGASISAANLPTNSEVSLDKPFGARSWSY